jgi:hypothetical protein
VPDSGRMTGKPEVMPGYKSVIGQNEISLTSPEVHLWKFAGIGTDKRASRSLAVADEKLTYQH